MAKRILRILAVVAVLLACGNLHGEPAHAAGATLYISSSGSDTSNCTNANAPCESLAYALTQAAAGDTIAVVGGAYLRTTPDQSVLTIPASLSPLTIEGMGRNPTLVPPNSALSTIYAAGMYVPLGMNLTLTGLTFNSFESQDQYHGGGALYVAYGATVTINQCDFMNNVTLTVPLTVSSYAGGGALYSNGTVTIVGSLFSGNIVTTPAQMNTPSTLEGGAIYNGGTMTITDSIVQNSFLRAYVQQSYNLWGGGIANTGILSISDSTIAQNHVAFPTVESAPSIAEGGGIYNAQNLSIADSAIAQNILTSSAPTTIDEGGGIFNGNVVSEISMSTIYGNTLSGTGSMAGAGIFSSPGGLSRTAPVWIAGSVLGRNTTVITSTQTQLTSNCAAPSGGSITSLGYNVVDDTGDCSFSSQGDELGVAVAYNYNQDGNLPITPQVIPPPSQSWQYQIPRAAAVQFGSTRVLLCPGVDQYPHTRPALGEVNCSAGDNEPYVPGTPYGTPSPPAFTSPTAAMFTVDTQGSFQLTASGSPAPIYTVLASGTQLPQGLTLDSATGLISGTPASGTAGIYNVSISADNGTGTIANETLSITVVPISTTVHAEALLTSSTYAFSGIAASSDQAVPAAGSLTFSAVVTKTKQQLGSCTASLDGQHAGNCSFTAPQGETAPISLVARFLPTNPDLSSISNSPIGSVSTPATLPSGTFTSSVGAPGTTPAALLLSGTAPATWSMASGSLPAGVALSPTSGTLNGTPQAAGSGNFSITATDSSTPALAASVPITYTIGKGTPTLTLTAPQQATAGQQITIAAAATGGGLQPSGTVTLSLGSATCTITLQGGSGSCMLTVPASAGTENIAGSYSGDGNYTSATAAQQITIATAVSQPSPAPSPSPSPTASPVPAIEEPCDRERRMHTGV